MGNIYSRAKDSYVWKRREHGSCRVWIQASSKGQTREALDFIPSQCRLYPAGGVAYISRQSTGH